MSAAKRNGRFSYLTNAGERTDITPPTEEGTTQQTESDASVPKREEPRSKVEARSNRGEGRGPSTSQKRRGRRKATTDALTSVPKGQGRMKQERSQLNVRLPTTLKRQASAKAVLEGRDIGEVIEELLREYLER